METKNTGKHLKIDKATIKKRILPTILISFMLPFIVFISTPFDIYGNNLDEFLFNLGHFLPILIAFFFLTGTIIFFALLFLPKKAYKIVSSIFVSVSLMFFLQSTYLNGGLNSLSGDNLNSGDTDTSKMAINAVVWIVVITISVFLAIIENKKTIISTIGIIINARPREIAYSVRESCVNSNIFARNGISTTAVVRMNEPIIAP